MTAIPELKNRFMTTTNATASETELRAVQTEIERCLGLILHANSLNDAEPHLYRLGELQEILAMAWFKHDIEILPEQKVLVRKYDRHDDPDLRKHVFEEIRASRFLMQ